MISYLNCGGESESFSSVKKHLPKFGGIKNFIKDVYSKVSKYDFRSRNLSKMLV